MTATDPSTMLFSARLRDETRHAHEAAERAPFFSDLLSGRLPSPAYVDLLAQLYRVYCAIEGNADLLADDPVVGGFLDSRLVRRGAIEADLTALVGAGWREAVPAALPVTTTYVERIWTLTAEWPVGYVAHHYTRYMGDLSGGRVIATMLRRHYGFDDTQLAMYRFDGVNPHDTKVAYRRLLDDAGWGDAERERLVAETRQAYGYNQAIADGLKARYP